MGKTLPRHNELIGKIKAAGFSRMDVFARKVHMSPSRLSNKLNGKAAFGASEIGNICNELQIPDNDITKYFHFFPG